MGGILLAIDGVHPENSHATRDMVRAVRSGRVCVAKPWLSSATAAIDPLIEAVLSRGRPSVGGLSAKQESLGVAVAHTLPMGPQQIGPLPDVQDVAPPRWEAARPMTKALHQKSRGIRDRERPAVQASSKDAPVVAEDGLARRPVMRAEGQAPLEPPGGPLDQTCQLRAASVERGRGTPPAP